MHRVAGIKNSDDFLAVPVDQGNLARVTQGHREDIVDIVLVLRLAGTILLGYIHLPAVHHFLHAPLGRHGRLVLQEARHDVDLLFAEVTGGTPVGHTAGAAVVDQHLEELGTALLGDISGQGLARRPFAQHAVTTGAALEIEFGGDIEFRLGHIRSARSDHTFQFTCRRRRAFVRHFAGCHTRVVSFVLGQARGRR